MARRHRLSGKTLRLRPPVNRSAVVFLAVVLPCLSATSLAGEVPRCEGNVLERRFALVQVGGWADGYIDSNGALSNICQVPANDVSAAVPEVLSSARLCGSSEEGAVYYQCELEPKNDNEGLVRVIETCSYSLSDQSLNCVNNTVSTRLIK